MRLCCLFVHVIDIKICNLTGHRVQSAASQPSRMTPMFFFAEGQVNKFKLEDACDQNSFCRASQHWCLMMQVDITKFMTLLVAVTSMLLVGSMTFDWFKGH